MTTDYLLSSSRAISMLLVIPSLFSSVTFGSWEECLQVRLP